MEGVRLHQPRVCRTIPVSPASYTSGHVCCAAAASSMARCTSRSASERPCRPRPKTRWLPRDHMEDTHSHREVRQRGSQPPHSLSGVAGCHGVAAGK